MESQLNLLRVSEPRLELHSWSGLAISLETELIVGDVVHVLSHDQTWALVRNLRDGQQGFVRYSGLFPQTVFPSHRIRPVKTLVLHEPSVHYPTFKRVLYMNSRVNVIDRFVGEPGVTNFLMLKDYGWVPEVDVAPLDSYEECPAQVAPWFLYVPYRYGGATGNGLDCSAFIQLIHLACGIPIPRNAREQIIWQGSSDVSVEDLEGPERNACVYWKDHVAIMVNKRHLIDANDVTMNVARGLLSEEIARRGQPLAYRRFSRIVH